MLLSHLHSNTKESIAYENCDLGPENKEIFLAKISVFFNWPLNFFMFIFSSFLQEPERLKYVFILRRLEYEENIAGARTLRAPNILNLEHTEIA